MVRTVTVSVSDKRQILRSSFLPRPLPLLMLHRASTAGCRLTAQLVGASLLRIRLKTGLLSPPPALRLGQGERKLSKPAGAVATSFKRDLAVRPSPDASASEVLKWLSQCGVSLSAATASSLSALPLSGAKLRELAALPKQAPAGGDSQASLDQALAAVSAQEDRAALVELISTFGAL